jgi:branched-chain amino acid transport system substrate-binding protein
MTRRHPLVYLVSLAMALTSCGGPATPAAQRAARADRAPEILVGAAWPWDARRNLLFGQGMEMALDEINGAGGIGGRRMRIVREDDHETVDQGRAVAQKLVANPDVVAVIGHMVSFITVPAAAIYDLGGVLLIAPTSTDPRLTEQGYKSVFRVTFNDKQSGARIAAVAAARGYRRMAIYYIRNDYGRGQANAFEEDFSARGGTVVDRRSYDAADVRNSRSVGELIDDWRGRSLDALFIAGEAPQAAILMVEARRKNLRIPMLGGDALGTPELFQADPAAVEGATIAAAFHADDPRPKAQAFRAAFQRRFGRPPDAAAALAYDSLHVLAEGMRRAKSSAPEQVRAALHALSDWEGVTASFSFSESGDLVGRHVTMVEARSGRFVFSPSNGGAHGNGGE